MHEYPIKYNMILERGLSESLLQPPQLQRPSRSGRKLGAGQRILRMAHRLPAQRFGRTG